MQIKYQTRFSGEGHPVAVRGRKGIISFSNIYSVVVSRIPGEARTKVSGGEGTGVREG